MMIPDPAPAVAVTREEQAAVEAALRRPDLAPRVRERLEMVKAAARGYDAGWIAGWTGRTPATVRRWLAAFRAGGVAALADAPRAGRPPKADAAYLAALEAAVGSPPRELGLPFDVWTSARLSAHPERATGERIAPGWLRVLLGRRRFACGRPKHALGHLQDPEEVAACEERLKAAGEKGGGRPRRVGAAPPGRDARRDQPLPVQGVAPDRHPADAAGGRHQPAADGLRE
jgi:transposase